MHGRPVAIGYTCWKLKNKEKTFFQQEAERIYLNSPSAMATIWHLIIDSLKVLIDEGFLFTGVGRLKGMDSLQVLTHKAFI